MSTVSPSFNKTTKNFKEQMQALFNDKLLAANYCSNFAIKTQPFPHIHIFTISLKHNQYMF